MFATLLTSIDSRGQEIVDVANQSSGTPLPCSYNPLGAVILRAPKGRITPDDIARCAAPVLWFSPDEPLETSPLPAPLPIIGNSNGTSVAYYRIRRDGVVGSGGFLFDYTYRRVVVVRYMFYYPRDVGFGGHWHDLESLEVSAEFTSETIANEEFEVVRIVRAAGAAHGIGWYSNILDVGADDRVSLPLHVLVEEGKHATSPDRNADGHFNPGFDVNRFTKDAWGIRDTLSSKYLPGSAYAAHMTKPRFGGRLVRPALVERSDPESWDVQYSLRRATSRPDTVNAADWPCVAAAGGTFRIKKLTASNLPKDLRDDARDEVGWLNDLLNGKQFCDGLQSPRPVWLRLVGAESVYVGGFLLAGSNGLSLNDLPAVYFLLGPAAFASMQVLVNPYRNALFPSRPYLRVREALQFGVRSDAGRAFMVFGFPAFVDRVPGVDGQLAFRYEFRRIGWLRYHRSFDDGTGPAQKTFAGTLLYTPSVSRIADWYAALGVDSFNGAYGTYSKAAVEGGVRLRFPLPKWIPIPFVGVRLGARTSDLRTMSAARPIVEVGLGAF
jgi:hypothetical protein